MAEINLETVHKLLEKLAEYVVNEVSTNRKVDARFEKMNARFENMGARFVQLESEFHETKEDVQETKENVRLILNGMDAQVKQLDIIRTEQVATNAALQRHEKRITALEEKGTGYRIRDAEE